jgi:uncharacterized protein
MQNSRTYTSFAGNKLIFSGDLDAMLLRTKDHIDQNPTDSVLIFEDQTGQEIDFDFRGTPDDVLSRLPSHPLFIQYPVTDETGAGLQAEPGQLRPSSPEPGQPKVSNPGPGRPRLGVTCREISLLPRHWEWLDRQPGGVSSTLRKLVDEARKSGYKKELARQSWDAAGKFMWVMAGNLPNFQEASRAFYSKNMDLMESLILPWPIDIRTHLMRLVSEALRLEKEAID